jgi:hypothetical protein
VNRRNCPGGQSVPTAHNLTKTALHQNPTGNFRLRMALFMQNLCGGSPVYPATIKGEFLFIFQKDIRVAIE